MIKRLIDKYKAYKARIKQDKEEVRAERKAHRELFESFKYGDIVRMGTGGFYAGAKGTVVGRICAPRQILKGNRLIWRYGRLRVSLDGKCFEVPPEALEPIADAEWRKAVVCDGCGTYHTLCTCNNS